MNIHRHINLIPVLNKFKFTEISEIYWAMSLKTMAISFVGVFIPIYLYVLGYSIAQVFLYYALAYFFKGILDDFFVKIILKYGPKHSFAFSFPLILLYLWMVMTLPQYNWNIYFLAFISGLSNSLSWMSYHVEFSKARCKNKTSNDISNMQALMTLAAATAPFIGGMLATRSGINNTFLLAMGALIIAAIPLFKTREPHIEKKLDMKKLKIKKIRKDMIGGAGMAVHLGALYEVWPLFIFLIVGTYESVGVLESVALVLTVATTIFIGRRVNSKNRHKILERGSHLNGTLWILRSFTSTFFHVLGFNIAHSVFSPFLRVPYFSEVYMHTDEGARIEYLLIMERTVDYARTVFFLLIALMAMFFSPHVALISGMLLAAIGAFMVSFLRPAQDEC